MKTLKITQKDLNERNEYKDRKVDFDGKKYILTEKK